MAKKQEKKVVKKPAKKKIFRIDGQEERFYEVDGIKYPSVTTILGMINKPALIGWAKKEVAKAIQPILQDVFTGKIKPEDLDVDTIIKMAKAKPKKITEEAGDIGTQVHKEIEILVNAKIKAPEVEWGVARILLMDTKHFRKLDQRVAKCLLAFLDWAEENNFIPTHSEIMVYSKKMEFAGTFDALGYVNGVYSLLDWKSSKAYYDEMAIQLSAYKYAWEEMQNTKPKHLIVLRLGKEDGDFEVVRVKNYKENLSAFKGAIQLWKWKKMNDENAKQIG